MPRAEELLPDDWLKDTYLSLCHFRIRSVLIHGDESTTGVLVGDRENVKHDSILYVPLQIFILRIYRMLCTRIHKRLGSQI